MSLLAPFTAALVGAAAGQVLSGDRLSRILAPLAVAGGVPTGLLVLPNTPGTLTWLPPVLVAAGLVGAVAASGAPRARSSPPAPTSPRSAASPAARAR